MIRNTGSPRLQCYRTAERVAGDAIAASVAIQFGRADAVWECKPAIIETDREHVEPTKLTILWDSAG
jgi:hypothetical protein